VRAPAARGKGACNVQIILTLGAIELGTLGWALGGLLIGGAAVLVLAKLMQIQMVVGAKRQAEQVLAQARSGAETLTKQIELDARQELAQRRESFDRKINESRNELRDNEHQLSKREDRVDRKLDALKTKEKYLLDFDQKIKKRDQKVAAKDAGLDQLLTESREAMESSKADQKTDLLRIGRLTEAEAHKEALDLLENEVQHEAAQLIQRHMEKAEEESKENALEITLQAIQRYASEHTSEATVAAIAIPNDDMKGRVIGREGRNIRAFEKATGVDVIVDDTPGVVVVSCFEPVRRAIAAEAMKKLLADGRIHPSRIEEVTEQTRKDIQQRIIRFGKDACIEAKIQGLHPKLSETMGRLHFRMSYGQNILRHSIETAYLCQVIADELGLDGGIARRCGYLHDIGKALDHDAEGGHPAIGMDFARRFQEKEVVLNAIGGHHNDIPATSPYTAIVMAADAISGARPGARRETLEKYVKRLRELEGIATDMKGVRQAYAIQAGREVRVIVDPERVDDANCVYIARDIAKRVSQEMTFPGEIRITVLREMRTVEYAR
jgi:ribonuclease Y